MATIITVHGTFATGPETAASGDEKWWQKKSPFEKHIHELVEAEDGPVKTQPLIWDGQNSEVSRRKAGKVLYEVMQNLDKKGEPFVAIGHSHGGSVIATALIESARQKNSLGKLQRWISIGTPFIKTRKDRFLFSRLGLFGKTVYWALLVGAGMILALALPNYSDNISETLWFSIGAIGLFLSFYLVAIYLERRRLPQHGRRIRKFANSSFNPRWLSFWHNNDEAVQGLRSIKSIRFSIFTNDFLVVPFNLLALFMLPVALIILISSPELMDGLVQVATKAGYDEPFYLDNDDIPGAILSLVFMILWPVREMIPETESEAVGYLFFFLAIPIALIAAAALITVTANFVAIGVSAALRLILNPVTMSQIKAAAFGSDTMEDFAIDAQDRPMWIDKGHLPLPDPLGQELENYSNDAAKDALPKFRKALTQFSAENNNENNSDMLSEYLTWKELIHTSYFNNERFRKLVAYAITQCEGFRPSPLFQQDRDYDVVAGWYGDLTKAYEAECAK